MLVLVKFPVDVYLLVLWRSVLQCMIVLVFHMLVGVHAVDLPCCLTPSICQCVSFCPCAFMHMSMIVRHFSHPCPFFRCGHHPFPLQQRKNSHPCPFVHAAVHMCIVANRFFPIVNHGSAFLFSQCCLIKVGWTFHICILTLGTVRLNLVYINQLTYDFSYSGEISVQSKYFSYIYFFRIPVQIWR